MTIVYPNLRGRGPEAKRTSDPHPAPQGVIVENNDTVKDGIANYPAAIVHDEDGWSTVYLFGNAPEGTQWPGVPVWIGPYKVLSEEVRRNE